MYISLKANIPMCIIFWRSAFVTDTGMIHHMSCVSRANMPAM